MINCKRLNENATLPKRGRDGDAGLDLFTCEKAVVKSHKTIAISTGIAIQIPYGMEGEVRPRSGISLFGFNGVNIQVIVSTIDSNYRGEIHIIVYNPSDDDICIPIKTKLAQIVISNVVTDDLQFVDELDETNRGHSKFGSSGI